MFPSAPYDCLAIPMSRLLLRYNASSIDDRQESLSGRLRYILVPVDALDNVLNFGIIVAFLSMITLVALAAYCIPVCCVNCDCCEAGQVESHRRKRSLLPRASSV
uniref:Uncharacterized protein n=1 Tax=Plectus sambesii TaxID=2011161 RepID=A0A914XI66_9BILA